ncbi:MAG: hypothetical protein Q9191_000166 [Dirinaria sp. TL-2023a]
MTVSPFWSIAKKDYQVTLQINEGSTEPPVDFPLVIEPREQHSKAEINDEAKKLAAQPFDTNGQSVIRQLLDSHGGVIHMKGLALKNAEDFSEFLDSLAGQGKHAWVPHEHIGMEVLRRPHARNVLNTNEGPPSHFIGWHNEYAVSPAHPSYLILFCQTPPGSGGETSVVSSLALYDRLKKEVPGFIEGCGSKGLVYQIPHTLGQVGGIVGGNGLYKPSAFGPKDGSSLPTSEEEKRKGVEARIIDLAERGGWHTGIDKSDDNLPVWQRRGFSWAWDKDGNLEVVHRVAGIREHPTLKKGSVFNAMSTRYTNAVVNNTFDPPHTFKNEDGTSGVAVPPHFAGLEKDEVIPREWLEKMDKWQHALESSVQWDAGDILIVDNYAAQHARWAWEGDRKILASFWDQPNMTGKAIFA